MSIRVYWQKSGVKEGFVSLRDYIIDNIAQGYTVDLDDLGI